MPTEVRIGLLVVGAVLVLAALVTLALRVPRTVRVLLGLFGVGLLAWGATLQLLAPSSSSSLSSSAPPANTPAPAPSANSSSNANSSNNAAGSSATAAGTAPPARADLTLIASSAFADCAKPPDPAAPPDGTNASKAQMVAAQQTMKAYDAGITAYTKCVDEAAGHVITQYARVATATEINSVRALDIKVHNDAVDQDTRLVAGFNQQLRIFLAKQRPYKSPLPPAP